MEGADTEWQDCHCVMWSMTDAPADRVEMRNKVVTREGREDVMKGSYGEFKEVAFPRLGDYSLKAVPIGAKGTTREPIRLWGRSRLFCRPLSVQMKFSCAARINPKVFRAKPTGLFGTKPQLYIPGLAHVQALFQVVECDLIIVVVGTLSVGEDSIWWDLLGEIFGQAKLTMTVDM